MSAPLDIPEIVCYATKRESKGRAPTLEECSMGDSYREEIKKRKKASGYGPSCSHRDTAAAHARSQAIQRQQSSLALRKGAAVQRRLLDA